MTSKCKYCGEDIEWPDNPDPKTGKKFPRNLNGTSHNCKQKGSGSSSGGSPAKPISKQTRWEGIKKIEEVPAATVNNYLINGWVILDRTERMAFREVERTPGSVSPQKELVQVTESIYIVGTRA